MASLKKRGKYYYIKFTNTVDGDTSESVKSLGITRKDKAEEAQSYLEQLAQKDQIDPFSDSFNPKSILKSWKKKKRKKSRNNNINTMRKAADYFYRKKAHLSNKTVNLDAKKPSQWGAYQRAVEHFISINEMAELPPKAVRLDHFERLIFKPDIKASTRRFYFRQLRTFWNVLLRRGIVDDNYIEDLKRDIPKEKENTRQKMINEQELKQIFNSFDEALERKKEMKDFSERYAQRWFKPMMATYFYGGFRKSEIAYNQVLDYSGLCGENLEYSDGQLEMIFIPATKGRKERLIPISKKWKAYLMPYLDWRGALNADDYIFVYHKNGRYLPVTAAQAYNEFKRYAKLAGLPKERTLHGMRHERVTTWLQEGYNTSEAQQMAGHSSSSVTNKYTHLKAQKLLEKQRRIEKRKNDN